MEFVVATNNKHKLAEMQRILQKMGHTAASLAEIGLAINPEETGTTFAQNALIKAKAVCAAAGRPAIADDSGLVVKALGGAPGVYSARFAGGQGDAANNEKLLRLMKSVPLAKRAAYFVSAIALVLPGGQALQVEGRCQGEIGFAEKGEGGFGYDPLFYVKGRSFAEITAEEKDEISHRAKALAGLEQQLPGFLQSL
ncbi:MAG: RdgB/HAM1 family non-canonical purine NTP pyrophosphatase [Oscillospiraceae bacterium]